MRLKRGWIERLKRRGARGSPWGTPWRTGKGVPMVYRGGAVVIGAEREMNKGRRKVGMLKNMVQPWVRNPVIGLGPIYGEDKTFRRWIWMCKVSINVKDCIIYASIFHETSLKRVNKGMRILLEMIRKDGW